MRIAFFPGLSKKHSSICKQRTAKGLRYDTAGRAN